MCWSNYWYPTISVKIRRRKNLFSLLYFPFFLYIFQLEVHTSKTRFPAPDFFFKWRFFVPKINEVLSGGFERGFEGCWENWQHSILQLVTLETTLRMYWRDPRLRVDHLLNNSTSDYILLHPETSKFIWFPDIYIGKIFQFWKLSKMFYFYR